MRPSNWRCADDARRSGHAASPSPLPGLRHHDGLCPGKPLAPFLQRSLPRRRPGRLGRRALSRAHCARRRRSIGRPERQLTRRRLCRRRLRRPVVSGPRTGDSSLSTPAELGTSAPGQSGAWLLATLCGHSRSAAGCRPLPCGPRTVGALPLHVLLVTSCGRHHSPLTSEEGHPLSSAGDTSALDGRMPKRIPRLQPQHVRGGEVAGG